MAYELVRSFGSKVHGMFWSKTQEFMCVEQIYVRKVKLFLTFNPNISSEIVDFQENGGVGDIQTQIPYFPL